MKKHLHTDAITNELAESVFFTKKKQEPAPKQQTVVSPLMPSPTEEKLEQKQTVVSRYHDTVNDTMIPSNHDTSNRG
jgi:hypothetical protein